MSSSFKSDNSIEGETDSTSTEMNYESKSKSDQIKRMKNRKFGYLLAFIGFFVLLCIGIVTIVVILFYFLSRNSTEVQIPPGQKKLFFNHFVYESGTDEGILRADSHILIVNEDDEEYNEQLVIWESSDEVFFITEEAVELSCDISCSCHTEETDFRRMLGWKKLSIVASIFGGIYLYKLLRNICAEVCRDEGTFKESKVADYKCEDEKSKDPILNLRPSPAIPLPIKPVPIPKKS